MPAVKTGMTPPPMPGMPAPMQPMGGIPPAPGMPFAPPSNPFAPMPPMPLAGGPPPQMPPMSQGQQMQGATAGRRRRFGDALEGMLGRNQGLGAAMPQPQRAMPPQMMQQQRMVAPGTPMMRTPPMQSMMPRPMEMGGEVDIFGYAGGGPVVQYYEDAGEVQSFDALYDRMKDSGAAVDLAVNYFNRTGNVLDGYGNLIDAYKKTAATSSPSALADNTLLQEATFTAADGTQIEEPEYNYTYEEAVDLNQNRAVKSAKEQAAIDAAIKLGGGYVLNKDSGLGTISGDNSSAIGASLGSGPAQYTEFVEDYLSNVPASAFDVGKTTQDANSNVRDLLSSLPAGVLARAGVDPNFEADGATGYYRQLRKIRDSGLGRLEKDALLNAMQVAHTAGYGDPDAYNPVSETMRTVQGTGGYAMQKRQQLSQGITRHSADRYMTDAELAEHNKQYMPQSSVSTITGVESGAGSAVGAGGNFGTGSYTASPVDSSEINPIDYSQFTGDVGSTTGGYDVVDPETGVVTPGTREQAALFGPRINIPQSVSQYYTDPVTGGLTTSYGPEMVATSPIGAIKLPARPVDIDIFDFLSTPTYGTMYSGIDAGDVDLYEYGGVNNMRMGGEVSGPFGGSSVPRSAMIADQPHMLAYINQDEEALLRSFGGSGIAGPGGIPSYFDGYESAAYGGSKSDFYSGGGFGSSYSDTQSRESATDNRVSDDDDDDYTPTSAELANELAKLGLDDKRTDTSLIDYTTTGSGGDFTTAAQADTDVSGAEFVANLTDGDDSGVNISQPTLASEETLPAPVVNAPVVYTDRRGNQYDSQAAADAADRAFAAQLGLYSSGQQGINSFSATARESGIFDSPEQANRAAARAYPTFLENYPEGREINIFDPSPTTYSDIEAIGGLPPLGDTRGGVSGVQPITSLNDPNITQSLPAASQGLEQYGIDDNILDLNVSRDPFDRDRVTNVPLTDDDMGLPSGPVSDIDRSLGGADRQTYYGGSGPRDERDMYQAPEESVISQTIMGFEGRTEKPYWDVNANRAGYGSDTKTDPITGKVTKITEGMTVSKAEADADLNRRLTTEFIPSVVNAVGADTFYGMNPQQQAALTSIAYNYGKLPTRIEAVVNNVDASTAQGQKVISDAIRSLEGDNDGVNRDRRNAEADLFLGQGDVPETLVVEKPDTGVTPEQRKGNVEKIKQQIGDQAEPTGIESIFYDVIGGLGFGLGKPLADKLRGSSRENRQAIIDQHVYALQNGATPKTDEDGNYVGFDISTMDTFADKVLGAEDIMAFMPPSSGTYNNPAYQADADGDGVSDYDRFQQVFGAQSTAADVDPTGMSTEQGFITSDGKEFFVDAGGNVVEVTDGTVPLEVGGGEDVAAALGVSETITGGDDGSEEIKNYTTDDDGNKVCNDEGYVYNPETDMCEPPAEEETSDTVSSPIGIGIPSSRRFDDIMASITTPAPKIAPISANIRPMQDGGMAGLNRTADNFLKALAG
jgi:GH24 family phage-related lysozyme (muramidase)